jgi:hypothetical protein
MPNIGLAESVLSLFTQPDVAASIAGDLAEEFAAKGFWPQVLRTAFALFFQQMASRPWRVAVLVLTGFVLTQIATSGILIGGGITESIAGPLLIAILVGRLSRGKEMTACALLALSSMLFSMWLGLFGPSAPLVWHFLQWNVLASLMFVFCGAGMRLRTRLSA